MLHEPRKQVPRIFRVRGLQVLVKICGRNPTLSTEEWDALSESETT